MIGTPSARQASATEPAPAAVYRSREHGFPFRLIDSSVSCSVDHEIEVWRLPTLAARWPAQPNPRAAGLNVQSRDPEPDLFPRVLERLGPASL